MREIELKYGCNPNQKPARIYMEDGSELPVEVLNGRPGYINFMDALNSWQLVRALRRATGRPAAASFKRAAPAGAAIASAISYAAAGLLLFWFYRRNAQLHWPWQSFAVDGPLLRETAEVGTPVLGTSLVSCLGYVVFASLVSGMGTTIFAAHSSAPPAVTIF